MTAEEVFAQYEKNRGYYKEGGITVTGGEPLLQLDFLLELFDIAKEKDVHTCIDTSGAIFDKEDSALLEKLDRLMEMTDLVLLDIKHIEAEKHIAITGQKNRNILEFLSYLNERDIHVWVRHVVVPGLTDDNRDLYNLGYFIGQYRNIQAIDVLPFHTMGASKYEDLGIPYQLAGTPEMERETILEKKQMILAGIKERRKITAPIQLFRNEQLASVL
jgi:pyruvate formate lyase activating enzyme